MSPVEQVEIRTARGDTVTATLLALAGEEPTVLVTVDDPDATPMPTVEFTIKELADFREALRRLSERAMTREGRWTTRR